MGYHLNEYFDQFLVGSANEEVFLKRFAESCKSEDMRVREKAKILISCMIDSLEGHTYASKLYQLVQEWSENESIFILLSKGWNEHELAGNIPEGWELTIKKNETNS